MKDLYIVGAGGCGREVLQIVKEIHRLQGPRWNIMGFLDDTEAPLAGKECDYGVVGTIVDYVPKEDDVLAMAVADPAGKRKVAEMLLARGAVFENILHPGAYLGEFNSIGIGNTIYGGFSLTVNGRIGRLYHDLLFVQHRGTRSDRAGGLPWRELRRCPPCRDRRRCLRRYGERRPPAREGREEGVREPGP